MYRTVVAAQLRRTVGQLNAGNVDAVLRGFAPDFTYRMVGEHALGGERHTHASQRAWFQRMRRLMADGHLELRDVLVRGWPWRTRVMTLLRVTSNPLPGVHYANDVAQYVEIRWGRVTRMLTIEDTQKLAGVFEQMHAAGWEEAGAPPIEDRAPEPTAPLSGT